MSWRTVVITKSAKLDYQMGFMVVRQENVTKIHLSEVESVMIETTAASITTALLAELVKKKINIIFCDEKRNPSSTLVPFYGSHDSSAKIRSQIDWDDNIKKLSWTYIVREKISNQAKVLKYFSREEEKQLLKYVDEIEYFDETNREGHAAKVYFNALFGMNFTRSGEDSINAALNYGYALLLSTFNRTIVSNGYITQLGLFHDNMFNPFNLASDLMEPFRPLVDKLVKETNPVKFEIDEKRILQNLLQYEVIIGGRTEVLTNAIKIYSKSVFDAIVNEDISYIKFYEL